MRPAVLVLILGLLASPAVRGDDTLQVESTVGFLGELGVPVTLSASHDLAIHGFSIAASYPPTLTVTGVDYSGTVTETASGGEPEFSEFTIDSQAGTIVLGVIFDLDPSQPVEIPPSPDPPGQPLVHLLVDAVPPIAPGTFPIELVNGLGDPPVSNAFTSAGQTIAPTLTSGEIVLLNPYSFAVRDTQAIAGETVDVIVEGTLETAIQGFTISLTHDPAVLTHVPLVFDAPNCVTIPDFSGPFVCLDTGTALFPEGVEVVFLVEEAGVEPGRDLVSLGVVFDFCPPFTDQTVPAGVALSLARFRFDVASPLPVGTTTVIDLTNDFPVSSPITNLVVGPGAIGIIPDLMDGEVEIVIPSPVGGFRRGDVDTDGAFGLGDAIALLSFLFVAGSDPPLCDDSADFDDSGVLGLPDPIGLLQFLFSSGCPPDPPHPGCGEDPTVDGLGCGSYSGC